MTLPETLKGNIHTAYSSWDPRKSNYI